ncbi:MAG: hypothetical protein HYV07_02310 [Deltaproteobacteria bacterium]|nr:hypothetical protein [Deltaproteobacteria bacterium]
MFLLRDEALDALRWQGIKADPVIGVLGLPRVRALLAEIVPGVAEELVTPQDVTRFVRSNRLGALVLDARAADDIANVLGSDAETIGIVAIGDASNRPRGVLAVVEDPSWDELFPPLRKALELRALHALELSHRCEARRISRREHELLGEPPETLSDDLEVCQPPPLPVGPTSSYDLESLATAFERAYVERVQILTESTREAAERLEVSAATLGRRKKRDA